MEQIIGIGVDQIEISRVQKACEKKGFVKKLFSGEEQELIATRQSCVATNFAGKEAVAKALGCGFRGIAPTEIVILRRESGVPYVLLYGRAKEYAEELGITRIHISLSDSKTMAVAYVVAVGNTAVAEEERGTGGLECNI